MTWIRDHVVLAIRAEMVTSTSSTKLCQGIARAMGNALIEDPFRIQRGKVFELQLSSHYWRDEYPEGVHVLTYPHEAEPAKWAFHGYRLDSIGMADVRTPPPIQGVITFEYMPVQDYMHNV